MYDIHQWRHVFKLDPHKEISEEHLEQICESGTDAVIVGGTDHVTLENVLDLMARIRRFAVPCVLEISNIESVTPGFDLYFIPTVLNSRQTKWIVDLHHEAMKQFGELMNWDEMFMEGYCILNKNCKAAMLTEAKTELSDEDIVAYALIAEKMYQLPIFYLEYSGTYGNVETVRRVKEALHHTRLFYGGGIESPEQAKEMAQYADTIVVGNAIYHDLPKALETVKAVKREIV
ncbi:heptaprenylglyceryl phosphate synthase [Anoxybacillus rupiensis]|jgi:putative glycerol-1-phosphate prenyltransferase|uniref:Heptaprenylglyceryl phosphate synthase n=1 Tax=Anoxybacteroides rupiense TaxID=311460 RepID=A0ABT5W2E5_9BACL|nr:MULTISPECIES: heptaprenylglyceryl phosphate synthase [Anoxybacillus]MBB3907723.1 putative glycerol-1-phosphate prenyltransferase [Anoxybacillus rupiensis]MBS2772122.1 heptaprenylglyceryl phosphate synthase [Anoxybacillus rupiensis]MDE8563492.1 heptaprenylglyceryl phosphate synthase [Anoxybacillus rupiensis]QHC02869.1 heptaprenylglyceryl phosphate synthase [Anoxybacillus sp. PDR2]